MEFFKVAGQIWISVRRERRVLGAKSASQEPACRQAEVGGGSQSNELILHLSEEIVPRRTSSICAACRCIDPRIEGFWAGKRELLMDRNGSVAPVPGFQMQSWEVATYGASVRRLYSTSQCQVPGADRPQRDGAIDVSCRS